MKILSLILTPVMVAAFMAASGGDVAAQEATPARSARPSQAQAAAQPGSKVAERNRNMAKKQHGAKQGKGNSRRLGQPAAKSQIEGKVRRAMAAAKTPAAKQRVMRVAREVHQTLKAQVAAHRKQKDAKRQSAARPSNKRQSQAKAVGSRQARGRHAVRGSQQEPAKIQKQRPQQGSRRAVPAGPAGSHGRSSRSAIAPQRRQHKQQSVPARGNKGAHKRSKGTQGSGRSR